MASTEKLALTGDGVLTWSEPVSITAKAKRNVVVAIAARALPSVDFGIVGSQAID